MFEIHLYEAKMGNSIVYAKYMTGIHLSYRKCDKREEKD